MIHALIAGALVALTSLVGVFVFRGKTNPERLHRFVLPLAVGVFLGIAFLELIPETLESSVYGPFAILAGFFGFYFISHILSTYHHHHASDHDACVGTGGARMLLLGDAVHNFADGIVISTAFFINPVLGIATTLGVLLHEVPQEIAEYGVLIASGYSASRALVLNLLSASTVFLGVLFTSLVGLVAAEYLWVVAGIAAGNLLYIATSDLIPELRHSHAEHFYKIFLTALSGVFIIALLLFFSHEFMEQYEEHGGNMLNVH